MRLLGEKLADEGFSVLGLRLTGHGTHPEDMIRSRWADWLASVEDGWNLLSGSAEQIVVMGLSMGGILALSFAARFPVSGVIAMSTPHHLPKDRRIPFIKLISIFQPYITKGPPDWHDLDAYRQQIDYPRDPVRAYAELRDLVADMQASLPKINAPVLLIFSKGDSVVQAAHGHAEAFLAELGSAEKEVLWVEDSGHIVTRDRDREKVFAAAVAFTHRVGAREGR